MTDNTRYIPKRLNNDDLFKLVRLVLQEEDNYYDNAFRDVLEKYYISNAVSEDVVREVFKESGLESIVDLFDTFETVNYQSILAFSALIILLKGNITGYKLVLDIIGFEYDLLEWWEQTPQKGKPNTFSIDVNLNASEVDSVYDTFQKIKRFTSEYILPKIDPLGFTMTIDFAEMGYLLASFTEQTRYLDFEDEIIDENLLFSNTKFILEDSLGGKWNVKTNNSGTLQSFAVDVSTPPTGIFLVERPDFQLSQIKVDTSGNLYADIETIGDVNNDFYLISRDENQWYFRVDNSNFVYVTDTP